jgi:hypothetical protein
MQAVRAWGHGGGSIAGAGRKGIGLITGARTTAGLGGGLGQRGSGWRLDRRECVVAEVAQDVMGAAAEFACDREAGAVVVEPVGDLEVVGMVGGVPAGGALRGLEERLAQQCWPTVGEMSGRTFLV